MPRVNLYEQLRNQMPEGLRKLQDDLGESFFDLLENPNIEAAGDALEQANRGLPSNVYTAAPKVAMVFGAAGLKGLPQFAKFLRKLRKASKASNLPDIMKVGGQTAGKSSIVQKAGKAYTETRAPAGATNRIAGWQHGQTGRINPQVAGEYHPIPRGDRQGGFTGTIGVYNDTPGGRNLQEMQGSARHELLHGAEDARATRRGGDFKKAYDLEAKTIPQGDVWAKHSLEKPARRAAARGERDMRSFIAQGDRIKHKLPEKERTIFDGMREIWEQSDIQVRNQKVGKWDTGPADRIKSGWSKVIGGSPAGSGPVTTRPAGKTQIKQALSRAQGKLPAGQFVDINGDITKVRNNEFHFETMARLRKAGKEHRGFSILSDVVRVPSAKIFTDHKKGARAALEQAFTNGWLRNGPDASIIVEVERNGGWASLQVGEMDKFLKNPARFLKKADLK